VRNWVICVGIVLGCAVAAPAAPIDFKEIPAGAKWLAHVDVDGMRDSLFVQRAYNEVMEKVPGVEGHFQKAERDLGTDVRRDLHSLTFLRHVLRP
jgi:hypothetical protein